MLVPLFLVGCAFQQAMHRGEKLAASGDWAGAYDAYAEASKKKPEDPEAKSARELARERLVEGELNEAKIALDSSEFERCKEHLDKVAALEPDHPEVFELTIDLEKTMGNRYDFHWQGGDHRSAYDLAVRARKILPKAVFLGVAFDQLRDHYTDEAEKLMAAREHEKALAALRTITEFEPDRQSEVAPTEQRVRMAWADTLSSRASTLARSGKTGAAAALYVRAYEVAGRASDLDASRPLIDKLEEQGKMRIQLDIEGPWPRMGPVRDALVAGLAGVSDTVVVRSTPALTMKITLRDQRCTEQDEKTPTTLDYVSGQREKPNPAYVELAQQLERAKADEETARKRAAELGPELQAAETAVKAFEDKIAAATRTRDEAKQQMDAANVQLTAAKNRRDDLQAQIGQQAAQGAAEASTAALAAQASEAEKRMEEWSGVLAKHEAAHAAASRSLESLEAQRAPAVEARDRLKVGNESVTRDRDAAKQLVSELTAKMAGTPKTVMEDVHETLRYDVHAWTRTCTAPASARAYATWKSSQTAGRTFTPVHTTKDSSHIGHEKAKLELDPKTYPETDAHLVATGDQETSKELVEWLRALADESYKARTDAAIDQMGLDPVGAATPILALYLGARDRVDPTVQGVFTAHLQREFGLEKPELLLAD